MEYWRSINNNNWITGLVVSLRMDCHESSSYFEYPSKNYAYLNQATPKKKYSPNSPYEKICEWKIFQTSKNPSSLAFLLYSHTVSKVYFHVYMFIHVYWPGRLCEWTFPSVKAFHVLFFCRILCNHWEVFQKR